MDRRTYLKTYRTQYKGRHKRVNLTLGLGDYNRLLRIATRDGKPVTTAAYDHLLAAMDDRPHVAESVARELSELNFLIANIANNINQLAHYSHVVRGFTGEGQLLTEIERLQTTILSFTLTQLKRSHDH